MHQERFEPSKRIKAPRFYRPRAVADRRLMREIVEKLCKNEKGRDFGQSSDAKLHRMLGDCHLSELAKV